MLVYGSFHTKIGKYVMWTTKYLEISWSLWEIRHFIVHKVVGMMIPIKMVVRFFMYVLYFSRKLKKIKKLLSTLGGRALGSFGSTTPKRLLNCYKNSHKTVLLEFYNIFYNS